jgi:hypothetical protein
MYGTMVLSPDGRLAALLHSRNRTVKLVSIPDGRALAELDTGEPLGFSPGGDVFNGGQLYAHFGLSDATNVDVLRIEWPSGIVQEIHDVAVRQTLTVTEPAKLSMTCRFSVATANW